jgi:hypothetical protein
VDLFLAFLKQCPRSESLAIHTVQQDLAISTAYVSSHIIPLLRRFTGPQDLVELFVPDRPVGAVTVFRRWQLDGAVSETSTETLMHLLNHIPLSSVPLQSISLPATLPSLDLLAAIVRLFPELRELSLAIFQRRVHEYGSYTNPGLRDRPLDTQCPELHDEHAFDGLPADELSDHEEEIIPPRVIVIENDPQQEMIASTTLHVRLRFSQGDRH